MGWYQRRVHGDSTNNMRSYAAVMMLSMLLVGVAVYAATEEVQDLGGLENTADAALSDTADLDDEKFDDDDDELGEGVGRGGGFLSTTGSFTLSGGGANGGPEEDELGEGVGRGGGFLSTQGSFTLSGGTANGGPE